MGIITVTLVLGLGLLAGLLAEHGWVLERREVLETRCRRLEGVRAERRAAEVEALERRWLAR
jgi:hypothetical protein